MNAVDGLEDKLQHILNDPQSMAQILSMAQSFGLQPPEPSHAPAPPNGPAPPPPKPSPGPGSQPNPPPKPSPGPYPNPPPGPPPSAPAPPMDPRMLQTLMRLMQQAQQSDGKQEALICALKPFLAPERREKMDRAMQIARISHLAGFALRNYGPPEKEGK